MLKIENLKIILNRTKTIDNISFCAQHGSITVITGGNGSGKTTLLSAIMGIKKVDYGKIWLDDDDITNLSIAKRAKLGISLAFQHPTPFKGITVQKLLSLANPAAQKLNVACEYLSQVGLCAREYLTREFNATLSGGERKRIELALTLARDAKVCIFDEPESGIDMWSFDNLATIFDDLKNAGKIVIIVSHNPKILALANQVLVLENGKIAPTDKAQQALNNIGSSCIKLANGGTK